MLWTEIFAGAGWGGAQWLHSSAKAVDIGACTVTLVILNLVGVQATVSIETKVC